MTCQRTYRTRLFVPLLLLAFTTVSPTAVAQTADSDAQPKTKLDISMQRVVVFKDGYCLVVKEAVGTTDAEGNIYSDDVPDAAVLGSFWTIAQEGKLESMVAGWAEDKETKKVKFKADETIELIEANLGAEATVTLDDKTKMTGRLKHVLGPTRDHSLTHLAGAVVDDPFDSVRAPSSSLVVPHASGTRFVLSTPNGDVAIDANLVRLLAISNMKTEIAREVTRNERTKQLRFKFDKPNQEVKLNIMYFRPGMRWIPAYRIDLSDDEKAKTADEPKKTARLTLQGEIINEAEDFHDVPIDIVVGVPNFRFRDVASPLILESVLRNSLAQAAPQLANQRLSNRAMMSNYHTLVQGQVGGELPVDQALVSSLPNVPTELTTKSGNDLFVYTLPKMSLRKGDRASVPILSADVPMRDVYTWEVAVKHTETISEVGGNDSPLRITDNTVWRQIELVNTSEIPWTTGSAMIVDGFQPLAQELLTYTPSGGKCRVPVTIAVDVRAQANDEELKRELDAMRFDKRSYAKVTGKIASRVVNFKDEPIDIEMAIRFGGKGDAASNSGEMVSTHFQNRDWHNYRGDRAVNSSTKATWSTTIEAGKAFQPKVDYHFYTRH